MTVAVAPCRPDLWAAVVDDGTQVTRYAVECERVGGAWRFTVAKVVEVEAITDGPHNADLDYETWMGDAGGWCSCKGAACRRQSLRCRHQYIAAAILKQQEMQ